MRKFDQCRLHYMLRISVLRRYKRIEANGKNSNNNVLIILHFFSVLSERNKFCYKKGYLNLIRLSVFKVERNDIMKSGEEEGEKFFEGFIGFEWDQSERIFIDVHE